MPFGNITAQATSYEPNKPGNYRKSGLAIGAPSDEFRLSGASTNSKSKTLSISVTRLKQKDFVPAGSAVPIRNSAICTINIQMPNDGSFTATEADSLLTDINEFITAATLTRLSVGEI